MPGHSQRMLLDDLGVRAGAVTDRVSQ